MLFLKPRLTSRLLPSALLAALLGALLLVVSGAPASAASTHRLRGHRSSNHRGGRAKRADHEKSAGGAQDLGQLNGVLPSSKLTEESAIEINLSKEYTRLPIYPGDAPNPKTGQIEKVWYLLLDASDKGLADDLGVNYAPKLQTSASAVPACVQTVTEENPSPANNHFGPAVIHFAGAPDFSPEREAVPGTDRLPAEVVQTGGRSAPRRPVQPVHKNRRI